MVHEATKSLFEVLCPRAKENTDLPSPNSCLANSTSESAMASGWLESESIQ